MKRRLTLAIGCLACAMRPDAPAFASQSAPSAPPTSQPSHQLQKPSPLSLAQAAQTAQRELSDRQLADTHSVVSIIFLKGAEPATSHYDVRIEPPARLDAATWLRGFSIALDGSVTPATGFRIAQQLSTSATPDSPHERGLGSGDRQG